ncbi:hypothetical protein GGF37_000825 [Kickxella alabastrina]|nr:hypothetical protein GGF37_000825 [Kickxella alabastrina]
MSNFSYNFDERLDLLSVMQGMDLSVVKYVCFYGVQDREVVFKQRYDSGWYVNHNNKIPTRPESSGLMGFISLAEEDDQSCPSSPSLLSPPVASFFINDSNEMSLFVSTVASYDSWCAGDMDKILEDANVMRVLTSPASHNRLKAIILDVFGVSVEESQVGNVSRHQSSKVRQHKISLNNLIIVDRNRITLLRKNSGNSARIFVVFNPASDAKVTVAMQDSFMFIISHNLERLEDTSFIEPLKDIMLSIRITTSENNEEERCQEANLLKNVDPRVFYAGIARHCPVKPIPFKRFASTETNTPFQILYPKKDPVLYKAKPGYFIGLKINKVAAPEDHAFETLPAFPCCLLTPGYFSTSVHQIYLDSKDDDDFMHRVANKMLKVSSPTLVRPGQVGSCYTPLNTIPGFKKKSRQRVTDWFVQLGCNFENITDAEYNRCLENFSRLGLRDSTTLRQYIRHPLHDIRITYHMFEERMRKEVVIYINRNKKIVQFVRPQSKMSGLEQVHVIIYETKGLDGFEVLTVNTA